MQTSEESLIGRVLGSEFEIRSLLARGGQAVVYRAYSRDRDTEVAVKVLSPRLSNDPAFRQRFLDEFRSLAQLHHENLIEVYRYGVEDGLVYIAMRMVPGGTLTDRLSVLDGPADLVTTARIISQVAATLQHAHDHGLVHLDIKPSNILLGRADWPLLADFGITRAVDKQETERGSLRVAGTPLFMSPEQCAGGPLDGRSDQYSLAVTAFEMLTGQLPFQATTTEQLLDQHLNAPPPRPRDVNPGVPTPVEEVLLKALEKNPDDRFPTIQEFGEALRLAVAQTHGVSLETKAALAGLAPNLFALLGLVILSPVLLSSLPDTPLFGTRMSLVSPFALVFSILVVGLLLRARWYLIGLLARGIGALADVSRPGPGIPSGGSLTAWARWRKRLVGAAEGLVNLAYVAAVYQLLLSPVSQICRSLLPVAEGEMASVIAVGVAAAITVIVLVGMARTTGPVVALGFGVLLLTFALGTAPTLAVGFGEFSPVSVIAALAAVVVLVGWLPIRRGAQRIALGAALPLLASDGTTRTKQDQADRNRRVLQIMGNAVDLFLAVTLLLCLQHSIGTLAYQNLAGIPVVYVVSTVAGVAWLVLTARLARTAGFLGVAFAVSLALPLVGVLSSAAPEAASRLTSLVGASPAGIVGWSIAIVAVLLLVASRPTLQAGTAGSVSVLAERQLVGPVASLSEAGAQQRRLAVGGLVRALGDVALLIVAYWLLGPKLSLAVADTTHSPWVPVAILIGLAVLIGGIFLASLVRARDLVVNTGAPDWGRGGALPFLAFGAAAFVVSGGAVAPTVVANPEVARLAVQSQAPATPHLVVSWQFWQPQTPSTGEATFNLAMSCSDGEKFGEFREAFRPVPGTMPNGTVASPTVPIDDCADWRRLYFALRHNAGVGAASSLSRSWLDERVTLNPDGTAEVVDTQRVSFTAGTFNSLTWQIPVGSGERIDNVQLRDGDQVYAINAPSASGRTATLDARDGYSQLSWTFPTIVSPAEHTYAISYHLAGASQTSSNGTTFQRQVVLPRQNGPIWRTTVEVGLPKSVAASAVALESTGSSTRHDIIDGHTAWFEATDLASSASLTVRVKIAGVGSSSPPTATPSPTPTPTTPPGPVAAALFGTPTAIATHRATATSTPRVSPTSTVSPSATPSPTASPSATASVSATPTSSASATASPTPKPVSQSPISTTCGKAPILAMYYDWYDMNSWNNTLSDQPAIPYVSSDRSAIERQVTEAQSVGIDGFEVNWWGPGNQTDTNLQTLLGVARAHNFKVTIDFDMNTPFATNSDQLSADISYLSRYYNDPAWFHFGGKPFIAFYGTNKYPLATWAAIRKQVDPNGQVFWMGEGDVFTVLTVFDGIHPYSIAWSPNPAAQLASYAQRARVYPGKVWMATAMPGYNDIGARGSAGFAVDRKNGDFYRSTWSGAVATNPDIINITSFNEWREGSMMEPSKSYGDLYLNLTRQFIGAYRAGQGC